VTPEIADPVTEKLVREAKAARVAEDMMSAITKLEQALQTSPGEANVLYELGLCHETMGIYDRAREYYHRVYQMGTSGAGGLYLQAADKLKQGFEQPQDKRNRIVLGRVRVFSDKAAEQGEKVIITIPVQSVPGEQIEGRDLEVSVKFFDEIGARKEIAEADTTSCLVQYKWITEPLDWGNGEELLQVSYCIPTQDRQEEHLFGEKHYYGQVVELSYKGELIDAQAWPRILAHKLNKPDAPPVFLDREMPPGYNPYNPLLPNAPIEDLDRGARPDFSEQDANLPSADYPADEALPLPVPPEYQNLPQP
jgi:tetratricopeptide (TPR) repeat protein